MSHGISRLTDRAPLIHRLAAEICFRVDDVKPSTERLPLTNARKLFEDKMGRPVEAFAPEAPADVIAAVGAADHSLVSAVYVAFSEHRPLVLTPDIIWLTLAQGFAQHINNHAEALRSTIVSHKGKVTLKAMTFQLATSQDWADVIQQWSDTIQTQIPAELSHFMICDFSTTTPITRTASQVVMLDAFQQYFDYELLFICGIPTITVKGSVQDWVKIRERVEVMAGFHLNWWTDRLKPICDGFIATVQGTPSQTFWKHIFSPQEVYGGKVITGWLADLFPYVKDDLTQAPTVRNPMLSIPRTQLTTEHGISPTRLPVGLSRAPFTIKSTIIPRAMELIAGFMGVKQDAANGQLEPLIGWAVLEEGGVAQLLTRLASTASTEVSTERSTSRHLEQLADSIMAGVPKEFIQLMERFNHGGVFFNQTPHPWSLKPISDLTVRQVSIPELQISEPAVHFMDLPDGRGVAYLYARKKPQHWWVIIGKPDDQEFHHDSVRVIAKGFLQFLQRLTEAEGSYYFDAPDFQPEVVR
jgi:hypothetical protein